MCQGLFLKAPVCLPALRGQRRSRALQSQHKLLILLPLQDARKHATA